MQTRLLCTVGAFEAWQSEQGIMGGTAPEAYPVVVSWPPGSPSAYEFIYKGDRRWRYGDAEELLRTFCKQRGIPFGVVGGFPLAERAGTGRDILGPLGTTLSPLDIDITIRDLHTVEQEAGLAGGGEEAVRIAWSRLLHQKWRAYLGDLTFDEFVVAVCNRLEQVRREELGQLLERKDPAGKAIEEALQAGQPTSWEEAEALVGEAIVGTPDWPGAERTLLDGLKTAKSLSPIPKNDLPAPINEVIAARSDVDGLVLHPTTQEVLDRLAEANDNNEFGAAECWLHIGDAVYEWRRAGRPNTSKTGGVKG